MIYYITTQTLDQLTQQFFEPVTTYFPTRDDAKLTLDNECWELAQQGFTTVDYKNNKDSIQLYLSNGRITKMIVLDYEE